MGGDGVDDHDKPHPRGHRVPGLCDTAPGNTIEEHVDEVEEIYMIFRGGGNMKVGEEIREVKEGDSIFIPAGEPHALENTRDEETFVLVIAAYPFKRLLQTAEK